MYSGEFVFQPVQFIKRRCSWLLCPISKYIMQSNMNRKILNRLRGLCSRIALCWRIGKAYSISISSRLVFDSRVSRFSFSYFGVGRFLKKIIIRWVTGELAYRKSAWVCIRYQLEIYLFSLFCSSCLDQTSRIKCFSLSGWLSRVTVFPVKQDENLLLLRGDMSCYWISESAFQCQN